MFFLINKCRELACLSLQHIQINVRADVEGLRMHCHYIVKQQDCADETSPHFASVHLRMLLIMIFVKYRILEIKFLGSYFIESGHAGDIRFKGFSALIIED